MLHAAILCASAMLAASQVPAGIPQAGRAPSAPSVTLSEGTELIGLARTAMREYLLRRARAEELPIPQSLKDLRPQYGAAITLRQSGIEVGRRVEAGGNLCHDVAAAALAAMRSPKLPDRITPEVLGSLTVELEILGSPRPLEQNKAVDLFRPGLTGLKLTQGLETSYLLPSTSYLLGLSADDAQRHCLMTLPLHAESASLPQRWAALASRHYVGYPGGPVVWLYRGKVLSPPEAVTEQMLVEASERIGEYLVRRQAAASEGPQEAGRYLAAGKEPAFLDHLYATFAMARLARRTGRPDFASSVNAALGYAARSFRSNRSKGERAYLAAESPHDQLAATALMVLALAELPQDKEGQALLNRLLASLTESIRPDGQLDAQLDGQQESPAATGCDAAMALTAIIRAGAADAGRNVQAAVNRLISRREPATQMATSTASPELPGRDAWVVRALSAASDPRAAELCMSMLARRRTAEDPPDECGGIGDGNSACSTFQTGLAAAATAEAMPVFASLAGGRTRQQAAQALEQMRRFCWLMTYRRYEAYFAADGEEYIGAVRARPTSREVTLQACAAAIEALLALGPPSRGQTATGSSSR